MKRLALLVLFAFGFSMPQAFAAACFAHSGMKSAETMQPGRVPSVEDRFFEKTAFLLHHQDEIGLSASQVNDIVKMRTDARKICITKDAEKEVVALDVDAALDAYPVDAKMLTGLIQQQYELKKEKALALADSYTKIRNSLSKEQYQAMTDLWKNQDGEFGRCPMAGHGMSRPSEQSGASRPDSEKPAGAASAAGKPVS